MASFTIKLGKCEREAQHDGGVVVVAAATVVPSAASV